MSGGPGLAAQVSIHDVMPATLAEVSDILQRLAGHRIGTVDLLVVPGRDWDTAGLAQLRAWARQGHRLVAHGWHHRARQVRGLRHRLHGALISRDAAEHLALDSEAIAALMRRSRDWFAARELPVPQRYVPPAWALGPLNRRALRALPYASVEVTGGELEPRSGRLRLLPLVGFEADTPTRERLLRQWNRTQLALARRSERPLRVAIHPQDFRLRLAPELTDLLAGLGQWSH